MKFCECVLFAAKFSEEKQGREGRREERKLNSDRGEKRDARDTHRFPLISFEAIALNPIDLGAIAG